MEFRTCGGRIVEGGNVVGGLWRVEMRSVEEEGGNEEGWSGSKRSTLHYLEYYM